MNFQSRFKNVAASALIAGMLAIPGRSMAISQTGMGWVGIGLGAASGLISYFCTDFFQVIGVNMDPAQLAFEALIYNEMRRVTDKWRPEPAEAYHMAAQDNENDMPVPMDGLTEDGAYPFETQALTNVGIEVLGLQDISSLALGQRQVMSGLTRLTYDGDEAALDTDLTQEGEIRISDMQAANYQNMSTAGIARAELGLETTYQSSLNIGGQAANTSMGLTQDASNQSGVTMAAAQTENPNPTLHELPGTIQSTGMAMRVQTLMNLELAQRINLANALQGNLLSIEAARALKNAPPVLK